MTTYKAVNGQTLRDIAVQKCGTIDALGWLAYQNGIGVDHVCTSGQVVNIDTFVPANQAIVSKLADKLIDPNGKATNINTGTQSVDTLPIGFDYWAFDTTFKLG